MQVGVAKRGSQTLAPFTVELNYLGVKYTIHVQPNKVSKEKYKDSIYTYDLSTDTVTKKEE